jgi:Flp pilus assembly protein protease CpaA
MPFDLLGRLPGQAVLVVAAAVLFYAAFIDLRHYTIRNEVILVLGGLFVVHALVSGRSGDMHWNVAFAAIMLTVMIYFYSRHWMGGGDVKMLFVALL